MHTLIYLLDAIYHHVVIGLMHITEGMLVIHILSIVILATLSLLLLIFYPVVAGYLPLRLSVLGSVYIACKVGIC